MSGYFEDNVFYICEFDEGLESLLIPLTNEIKEQAKLKDGLIDLYINSPGGYAYILEHFVQLVEAAKREGVVVRTIVPEMAYSAGSMLAITGTVGERYIGRRAEHLAHYGEVVGFGSTTPLQAERFGAKNKRTFKHNYDHYQKYCQIPNLEKEMLDDGFFIPASKAIKWKLADKYMDKFVL